MRRCPAAPRRRVRGRLTHSPPGPAAGPRRRASSSYSPRPPDLSRCCCLCAILVRRGRADVAASPSPRARDRDASLRRPFLRDRPTGSNDARATVSARSLASVELTLVLKDQSRARMLLPGGSLELNRANFPRYRKCSRRTWYRDTAGYFLFRGEPTWIYFRVN